MKVDWILDTHPHADHFSAAHYLKAKTGAPTAIGERIVDVQKLWTDIYNFPISMRRLAMGPSVRRRRDDSGSALDGRVLFSPGHTLCFDHLCVRRRGVRPRHAVHAGHRHGALPTFRAAARAGSGIRSRPSWRFPTRRALFTGHDYRQGGREARWESTRRASRSASNTHLAGRDEAGFVALREARDRTLPMPKLILHALQVNLRGGRLPDPESNGRRYLKLPLDAFPARLGRLSTAWHHHIDRGLAAARSLA